MPMYFPDFKSVKDLCETMEKHRGAKKYDGIIPQTEADLPEARKQMGAYLREVWKDDIFAIEVEEAVTPKTYDEKIKQRMIDRIT